jgi:hypothetical protein
MKVKGQSSRATTGQKAGSLRFDLQECTLVLIRVAAVQECFLFALSERTR